MGATTAEKQSLLIVDDDPLLLDTCEMLFEAEGIEVTTESDPHAALSLVESDPNRFPVMVLDYFLPDIEGAFLADEMMKLNPDAFVFIFSGASSFNTVRSSFRSGAQDFFRKGDDSKTLIAAVKSAFKKTKEKRLKKSTPPIQNSPVISKLGMVGVSTKMEEIASRVELYRSNPYTVFILGETGTGKELIAQAIARGKKGAFCPVNCGSFRDSDQLIESELFGYEKGAFTGANQMKRGLFESAKDGVIFLDEIHELGLSAQVKLLRVLQEKKIRRVGGVKEIPVEVKVVAAAKPQIIQKRDEGRFLVDLYNRLNVFRIDLPPLKERNEDIEPLVYFFCEKYSRELGKTREITTQAIEVLKEYSWPGNVRELQNVILRLVVDSMEKKIEISDPASIGVAKSTNAVKSTNSGTSFDLKTHLMKEERAHILSALVRYGYRQTETAKALGMPESTLRAKMKKFEIDRQKEQEKGMAL